MISIDPAVALITLLMAIGLIVVGRRQIGALRQQVQQASDQVERLKESISLSERANRAQLLLGLYNVYEEIVSARRDVWVRQCKNQYPTDMRKCYQQIATLLGQLRTSENQQDIDRYYGIRKVLDFGELVGFLVEGRQLLEIDDIKGLWGTTLKHWATWFHPHIEELRAEYTDAFIFLEQLSRKL